MFFNAPDGHSNRKENQNDLQEFEMQVKTYLEENLGADVTVSTYTARKNNQTLCQGLLIEDASDGERFSASPVIYLDDFYRDLCNGSSFEEIAKTIYKLYRTPSRLEILS